MKAMKIICIGRNYLAHIKELDNALPTEPLFFMICSDQYTGIDALRIRTCPGERIRLL